MHEPLSRIIIYLRCSQLLDMDVFSKSDPQISVKQLDSSNHWIEIGRTEKILNDLNPVFHKPIEMDYFFERVQKLRFEVYDVDDHTGGLPLEKGDFLGQLSASVAELVRCGVKTERLNEFTGKPMSRGSIEITVREVESFREQLRLVMSATNLPKKGFIFSSYPSTRLVVQSFCNDWRTIHSSNVVPFCGNPAYAQFVLPMFKLSTKPGNVEDKIKMCLYDKHKVLETVLVTISELLEAANTSTGRSWKLGTKGSSFLVLKSCVVEKVFTFFEYIQDGLELDFAVAIDFTASNGDPRYKDSLHYVGGTFHNDYTHAIETVGRVIEEYDTDHFFPVLGFGAKLPPNYSFVSHDFAVNMNAGNPNCFGVDGILAAYRTCLPVVRLYGPTNFEPVIRHLLHIATNCTSKSYFVLLILTDGVITDLSNTRDAIIEASHAAMSIIIVGVGNADFAEMNLLDSDDSLLKSSDGRRVAKRDIVQFVSFNEYRHTSFENLARQVLEELPQQVTQYYNALGIFPNIA